MDIKLILITDILKKISNLLNRRKTFSKYPTGCPLEQPSGLPGLATKGNPEGPRVVTGHHSQVYCEHVPTSQGYTNTAISSKWQNFCGERDPADLSRWDERLSSG